MVSPNEQINVPNLKLTQMKLNDIIEKKKGVEAHGNYQFFSR